MQRGRNPAKRLWLYTVECFAVLGMLAGGLGATASPASAATGNILPPFDVGQRWNICQGYGGSVSHTGTASYALDLTGAGCDNSASGRNVRAPIGGSVHFYQASTGTLCINAGNGKSVALTHINSSIAGGSVSAGQLVGTVAAPGQRANRGVAHIHLQMWSQHGCWDTGNGAVPFDSGHGARICGAPDLTANGPSTGNGAWSGTSFTGQSCGPAKVGLLALLKKNGDLNVQKTNGAWVTLMHNVTKFQVNQDKIFAQKGGALWRKTGVTGAWTRVRGSGVKSFSVEGDRIAVILTDGTLHHKSGNSWPLMLRNVTAVDLDGDKSVARQADGALRIKTGTNGSWRSLRSDVRAFDIEDGVVAVVQNDGTLRYKNGSSWPVLFRNAKSVVYDDGRFGAIQADGTLRIRNGPGGTATKWADGVLGFDFRVSRVGIIKGSDSRLCLKKSPTGTCGLITTGVKAVQVL